MDGKDDFERLEETLDPHRREERAAVAREVVARLRARGVRLDGHESTETLADLLDAAEQFEREVEAQGGDLFVDSGDAREPDDPRFVLPRRAPTENSEDYIARI